MKKWDGHTHTEFCPHGSHDATVDRIEKAIELGFTQYSLTEHAPLPEKCLPDSQLRDECGMSIEKTKEYFQFSKELKKVYQKKITVLVGLEVDFLDDYKDFTKDLIDEYQHQLDEWIISIHFLKGKLGLTCLDYSPAIFEEGLISYYGSIDQVHFAYWHHVEKLLQQDFVSFPPHRIGHLGLIRKYIAKYPTKSNIFGSKEFYQALMKKIKSKGYGLDFNTAGLSIATCGENYLTNSMLHWCKEYEIELVYGSDAHNTASVGKNYETTQNWL